MGLGHFGGGVAAARYLARQGARITVTDLADEAALSDSLNALQGEVISEFHLGGHRQRDFSVGDLVVVNPAVRPENPLLEVARRHGVALSSEIELFMRACPAPIIAVTGSNGKSTTAAMTAAIFEADGRRTWLGGNIGRSLLENLDEIGPDDAVVLEISSFQLEHLGNDAPSPRIAVVTGCRANHLDWHGSYRSYVRAKQRILTCQTPNDLAVLNTHDAEVGAWGHLVRGRQLPMDQPPVVLAVPGEHNRINAACAAAAAAGAGCDVEAIRTALEAFAGLPQRLEQCAVVAGRRFYNDSTATTPESTVAALESLEGPLWLLAGGRDKGCDFNVLTAATAENARGAAFFGETGEALQRALAAENANLPSTTVKTMAQALQWCWACSRPGDAILLSPGCASGDQFADFRRRGEQFVDLVHALADSLEDDG